MMNAELNAWIRASVGAISLLLAHGYCLAEGGGDELAVRAQLSRGESKVRASSASKDNGLRPFSLKSLDGGRIDPKFRGISLDVAAKALMKFRNIEKGEFEGDVEFRKRRDDLVGKEYLPHLMVGDLHAVILPVEREIGVYGGVGYQYDADKGVMKFRFRANRDWPNEIYEDLSERIMDRGKASWGDFPGYQEESISAVKVSEVLIRRRNYMASNALGVNVEVIEEKVKSFLLGLDGLPESIIASSFDPITIGSIEMEPKKAAKCAPTLRVAIVFHLVPPFLDFNLRGSEATLDHPIEFSNQEVIVRGVLDSLVVYSGVDGEVLLRFPDVGAM